jgi:hypothetical protein
MLHTPQSIIHQVKQVLSMVGELRTKQIQRIIPTFHSQATLKDQSQKINLFATHGGSLPQCLIFSSHYWRSSHISHHQPPKLALPQWILFTLGWNPFHSWCQMHVNMFMTLYYNTWHR